MMTPSAGDESWHGHRVFGLRIRSAMPLPELLPDGDGGDPDAHIVYGAVPAELAEPSMDGVRFQAAAGILLLQVERVAPYLVTAGLLARFLAGVGVLALPAAIG